MTGFTTPPFCAAAALISACVGTLRSTIQAYRFPLAFVIHKKEGLVLFYWAAERTSELVVVERGLRLWAEIEEIARAQVRVAEVFKQRAMRCIRPRLSDNVDHCPRIAAVFGREIRDYRELRNRIDRQNGSRRAENASFVDSRVIPVPVIHICAIDKVII